MAAKKLPAGWTTGQGGWAAKQSLGSGWEQKKAANGRWYARKTGGGGGGANAPDPLATPEGWGARGGDSGITGSWDKRPNNINSDNTELAQNAAKKWFGRPITEMTGLDPWMRKSVETYDAQTRARSAAMTAAQIQGAAAVGGISNAASLSLANLGGLVGAAAPSQALGGVSTGGGPVVGQTVNNEAVAAAVQAGSAAKLAMTNAASSALTGAQYAGTVAQDALRTAQNRNESDAAGNRQKLVASYQTAVMGAKTAQSQAVADTYNAQARILAATISAGGQLSQAQLRSMTDLATNQATNEANIYRDSVSDTVTAGAAVRTAGAARAKTNAKFVDGILKRVTGTPSVSIDPDGKERVTVSGIIEDPMQIINEALQKKIPLGQVLNILAGTTHGSALKAKASQIAQAMYRAGIPAKTIQGTIQNNLGMYVNVSGGALGPPRRR